MARKLEGMRFAVGPTIVARKAVIAGIGGWDRVKDYLAEELVFGQFAAEAGFGVGLSRYVIEHRIGSQPFAENARHRLRWCRSTRRSRPAGYVGQLFTNPLPLALLLVLAAPAWWPGSGCGVGPRPGGVGGCRLGSFRQRHRTGVVVGGGGRPRQFRFLAGRIFWKPDRLARPELFTSCRREVRTDRMRKGWIGLLGALTLAAQQPPAATPPNDAPRKDVVVVTGTYEEVPLEEVDRNVKRMEVRGDAALLSNTVTDFLNQDSSIDLRQRGQNNIQTDVSIRGASFGQTLVLLNGIRMNDVQSGRHNMDLPVPMDAVDRIEVLKGAGSTLYGSDAIGGVINVITRPPEVNELRVRTGISNFGVNQQRATATLARGRWTEQLGFSRDFSSGFRYDRDYRNLSFSSSTSVQSKLGLTSILLATVDKPFGADQFYGNFNSWERTRTWFASIQQGLGQRTMSAFAYRRHTDLFVLYRDRPEVSQNRHPNTGRNSQDDLLGSVLRSPDEPHALRLRSGQGGSGLLEAIVAVEELVADDDRGNAPHATRVGLSGGVSQLVLDRLRLNGLEDGVRVELAGSGGDENVVDVGEIPAAGKRLAERGERERNRAADRLSEGGRPHGSERVVRPALRHRTGISPYSAARRSISACPASFSSVTPHDGHPTDAKSLQARSAAKPA